MKSLNKGSVVFKHKAEDFIVEEINEDGKLSQISDSIGAFENAKIDFGNVDVNDRRDFIMFDIEKLNIDHFSLISILCKELNKQPHEIGYAGTKDKLAWTCQRISIFNPDMEKIRNFSYKGIILKNFRWGKHKIKIGDLKGNRFRVVLRDADNAAIKILNRVRNTEFIPNFFGTQRFGSLRKDNFQIGKLILKKKYKEAVFAYLTGFGSEESKEVKEAKKKLKLEKDIYSAKEYFPKELQVEHRMIEYLSKDKDDYLGALTFIGEKIVLLMCQSVQSRLFNDLLEKLIDRGAVSEEDSLNIPGYDLNNAHGKFKRVTEELLEENNLEIEDFKNKDIPFLSLTTLKRKAFFKVKDVIIDVENDDIFNLSKKIKLQFTFDSGSYATTFLEYFFDMR
jgi:tRNA pseudouridine13 synthase